MSCDPDICDAVLERDDGDARLRELADADLFVAPVDAHGEAYRVHGLFVRCFRRSCGGTGRSLSVSCTAAHVMCIAAARSGSRRSGMQSRPDGRAWWRI